MPFILPALPAIIGAGGAIAGGLLGSKKSSQEKQALEDQAAYNRASTEALQKGISYADTLKPTAQTGLSGFFSNLGPAADYWRAILSGDKARATSMLAPQIRQISEGYDTTRQTGAELMPRGGASASLLSELPYRKAGDINDLYSKSRTEAASALPQIASMYGTTGTNLLNMIMNAYKTGGPSTSGLLNYGLQNRQSAFETGNLLGGGIYDLLKKINFGGSGGKSNAGIDIGVGE